MFQNMTHIEAKASHCVEMPEKQAARNKDWGREYCTTIIQKKRMHQTPSGCVLPIQKAAEISGWCGTWKK